MCETKLNVTDYSRSPIKYLEISKIKLLNPFSSAIFLLKILDDQFDIDSNKSSLTSHILAGITYHLKRCIIF